MNLKLPSRFLIVLALLLAAGIVTLTLALGRSDSVSADSPLIELHVTKECSAYTGAAGDFCTITSSDLAEIAVGSKVFYARALDLAALSLNSNVVLDDGAGNTAVGHCRLDLATGLGQCTFSGGTGTMTGLHARVDVSYLGGADWAWDGTYRFAP